MAGMLNLGDVLELIDDRFNNRPATQQDAIRPESSSWFFMLLRSLVMSWTSNSSRKELRQGLGNVALISKELAKQLV